MTTFLILVILFIGYLLWDGRKSDHHYIQKQGGMIEKYKILISHLTNGPNPRIEKVHNNTVIISVRPKLQLHSFKLFHQLHTLTVEWKAIIPLEGEIVRRWEFLENVNQDEMAEVIFNEMDKALGVDVIKEAIRKKIEEEENKDDIDLPF